MKVGELKRILNEIAWDDDEVIVTLRGKRYITVYGRGQMEVPVDLQDEVDEVEELEVDRIKGRVEIIAWA